MNRKREVITTVAAWAAFGGWLLFTEPTTMPVYFLFVPFALLGFAVYRLWKLLVLLNLSRKANDGISRKQRAAGITLGVGVVVLIGMQSLGELTARDLVTVVLFALVFYFYLVRNLLKD